MIDFSIITISFNQAQYLKTCLDSVTSQRGASFEYIVVDPGSTDGSRAIIEKHDGRIDHVITKKDRGPADGLNNGCGKAKGRYLMFINADDVLLPQALAKISALLHTHSYPDLLLCGGWLVNAKGIPQRRLFSTRFSPVGLVNSRAALFQQGMVFKRELFEQVGGFNRDNKTCWDYELLVDFIKYGAKPVISTDRVAAFRMHDESISSGFHGEAMEQQFQQDLKRIHDQFRPDDVYSPARHSGFFHRIEKYWRTPEIIPYVLSDKFLKHRIQSAWAKDTGPKVTRAKAAL